MSRRSSAVSRPNGVIIREYDSGKVVHSDTVQCVHCGGHWEQVLGASLKGRGFCFRCMGPVCGAKCAVCNPQEKQYEEMCKGIWIP